MPRGRDHNLIQFLLFMLFFAGAAIVNWLKQRAQRDQPPPTNSEKKSPPLPWLSTQRPTSSAPSTAPQPKPAARKIDWEAELRRMLEGNLPTAPPPVPPSRRPPTPAPPSASPPVITLPPLTTSRAPLIRPVSIEQERGLPVQLPGLVTSTQTYARASQLDAKVAEHLRQVAQQVQSHRLTPQTSSTSLEVAQTLALVRDRQTLRSIIMASVILGPPKALELP